MRHEPHALGVAIRTCVHEAGMKINDAADLVFADAEANGYAWTGEPDSASVLSTLGLTNGDAQRGSGAASSTSGAAPPQKPDDALPPYYRPGYIDERRDY